MVWFISFDILFYALAAAVVIVAAKNFPNNFRECRRVDSPWSEKITLRLCRPDCRRKSTHYNFVGPMFFHNFRTRRK